MKKEILTIETNSEKETYSLGYRMGQKAQRGQVFTLVGDLGTGKTVFTKGVAAGLGIEEPVSSPTFTIVNEYVNKDVNIYHFDVYRLEDEDEFYAIGGEEYFETGICLIEWGEMIAGALPKNYIHIIFSRNIDVENERVICIERK